MIVILQNEECRTFAVTIDIWLCQSRYESKCSEMVINSVDIKANGASIRHTTPFIYAVIFHAISSAICVTWPVPRIAYQLSHHHHHHHQQQQHQHHIIIMSSSPSSFAWSLASSHHPETCDLSKKSRGSTRDHEDVIKWQHFPRYWPFVRGIHRLPLNSLTKASDAELWCLFDLRLA